MRLRLTAAVWLLLGFILLWPPPSPWAASGAIPPKAATLVADGQAIDLESERYGELFKELARHEFSPEELRRLFAGVKINKRVLELMDTQLD